MKHPENLQFFAEALSLKSVFGNYTVSFKLEGKRLLYTRKLIFNNIEQPKEAFGGLLDFMREIEKADKMKVVLVANAK